MPRGGKFYSPELRLALAKERGIEVDPEDEWLLAAYSWSIRNQYDYVVTSFNKDGRRINIYLHHCIVGAPVSTSELIDHIDRNRRNNRRSNLRYTTYSENQLNSARVDDAYHICKVEDRFVVQIKRGDTKFERKFDTIEEAECARDQWLREYNARV